MRILVTGGAGYIGINTSLHLLKGNHEIFIVDNLSNSHLQSIKRLKKLSKKNFLFSKTDLREEKKLEKIFSKFKPNAVMHFAGLKSVEESMTAPIDYFDANVSGSIKLLNCMNKFNCKKIVFSSSGGGDNFRIFSRQFLGVLDCRDTLYCQNEQLEVPPFSSDYRMANLLQAD